MRNGVPNNQMEALAMAMAGAAVAAIATMFIPVVMLESFTGSTGISELVPATAAPLGDTARAIIAFAVGALTLAVLGSLLTRQANAPRAMEPASSFKDRLGWIAWPKMPWTKDEDDITDLSDLPKLRNGDAHPDAPPRRPLSAHQDLPVLELDKVVTPLVEGPETEEAPILFAMPAVEIEAAETRSPEPVPAVGDMQPTLAEMMAKLEAAGAERQKRLADLEIVAAKLAAVGLEPVVARPEGEMIADVGITAEPARTERPVLEAVPPSPVEEDDMDAALAAALATLHRMNATGR